MRLAWVNICKALGIVGIEQVLAIMPFHKSFFIFLAVLGLPRGLSGCSTQASLVARRHVEV